MNRNYAVRRLLQIVPSILVILSVTFAMSRFVGGDVALANAQENDDPARIAEIRARYGLDDSLPEQFLAYLVRLVRGDLGDSIVYGRPVANLIGERLGPTLLLTGSALALSVPLGILLGAIAARRPFGWIDRVVQAIATIGYAIPVFFVAQLAVIALVLRLHLLPLLGYTDPRRTSVGLERVADIGHHLILPVLVLALSEFALVTRLTRTGLVAELGKDYSRTAMAKGLTHWDSLTAHALPNAILPVVTVIGTRLGFLLAGAVIIEEMFSWPGIGTLLVGAARAGDRILLVGLVLLFSLSLLLANLVTDLVYARIDPRIRYR